MAVDLAKLQQSLLSFLRPVRDAVYDTADDFFLRVNLKKPMAPWSLRRYVGPLNSVEHSPAMWHAIMSLAAGLTPESKVVDIGCGFGGLALHLRTSLGPQGGYEGLDLYPPLVEWAQKNITPSHPNYRFKVLDIRNGMYNPKGAMSAETIRLPFDDDSFDIATLKSVFTHLRKGETEHYLDELCRILKPGGRCVASFFLLNDEQKRLEADGKNYYKYVHGEGVERWAFPDCPECVMAYDQEYLWKEIAARGFKHHCAPLLGNWAGRKAFEFQDILILEKA